METTERTFGVCRYCGQLLNIKSYLALHPNIDDPDEDGIATLICDCKEARRDRDAHEAALGERATALRPCKRQRTSSRSCLPATRTRSA